MAFHFDQQKSPKPRQTRTPHNATSARNPNAKHGLAFFAVVTPSTRDTAEGLEKQKLDGQSNFCPLTKLSQSRPSAKHAVLTHKACLLCCKASTGVLPSKLSSSSCTYDFCATSPCHSPRRSCRSRPSCSPCKAPCSAKPLFAPAPGKHQAKHPQAKAELPGKHWKHLQKQDEDQDPRQR